MNKELLQHHSEITDTAFITCIPRTCMVSTSIAIYSTSPCSNFSTSTAVKTLLGTMRSAKGKRNGMNEDEMKEWPMLILCEHVLPLRSTSYITRLIEKLLDEGIAAPAHLLLMHEQSLEIKLKTHGKFTWFELADVKALRKKLEDTSVTAAKRNRTDANSMKTNKKISTESSSMKPFIGFGSQKYDLQDQCKQTGQSKTSPHFHKKHRTMFANPTIGAANDLHRLTKDKINDQANDRKHVKTPTLGKLPIGANPHTFFKSRNMQT